MRVKTLVVITWVLCVGMQNCLAPATGMYIAVNGLVDEDTL